MSELTFDQYQKQAITTKIYDPSIAIPYCVLGITGEAGEVAEKVKKILRDDFDFYKQGIIPDHKKEELGKEIGDVLWYLAALCDELDISISDIAQQNIDKLAKRKEEGKLGGSGDNR